MHYHAHVYWNRQEQRLTAIILRDVLHGLGCSLGRVWDQPIGPHPLPMYQVNFDHNIYDAVISVLTNKNLNVLIHEDTGDDVRDHTEGAQWIGDPLELNIKWLEEYVKDKTQEN